MCTTLVFHSIISPSHFFDIFFDIPIHGVSLVTLNLLYALLRCGGLLVMSHSGQIKVNNTFNARLFIASEQLLPVIRQKLFQSNFLGGLSGN